MNQFSRTKADFQNSPVGFLARLEKKVDKLIVNEKMDLFLSLSPAVFYAVGQGA